MKTLSPIVLFYAVSIPAIFTPCRIIRNVDHYCNYRSHQMAELSPVAQLCKKPHDLIDVDKINKPEKE